MPRTEELKVFHTRDLHKAGIYKDVAPTSNDIPPNGFQDCKNTRFRLGAVEVVPGWLPYGSPALDSRVMHGDQYFKNDGTENLLAMSTTSPWRYDTTTGLWVQITPGIFTGGADDLFTSDIGFDTFVATNGKDAPMKYTGAGNFTPIGGLNAAFPAGGQNVTQVRVLRFFNGFTIAMATSENGLFLPQRVRWGRQGFLEQWDNDINGNGQAGYYDLSETPDWILNGEALSGSLLVMKERSLWLMQYVGLPIVFLFRKVVSGIGLMAARASVSLGDEIIFLGQDNFYAFGGYNLQEIGDNRVTLEFFQDIDSQYASRIQAFFIEEEDEIWFIYPSSRRVNGEGEMDTAVVYNHITKTWSFRDVSSTYWFYYQQFTNLTWDTMPDTSWDNTVGFWDERRLLSQFPINLFGTTNGQVMVYGNTYSQNGVAYTKNATTKLQDFSRPDINKRVQRVEVAVDRAYTGNLNVYVGHCAAAGDPIVYSGPFVINMAPGKSRYFTCDITDLLFCLKFETTGSGDPWRVIEYQMWFIEMTQQ